MSREVVPRKIVRCDKCGRLLGSEPEAEGLFVIPVDADPKDYDYPESLGWLIDAPGDWCADCRVWSEDEDDYVPPGDDGGGTGG